MVENFVRLAFQMYFSSVASIESTKEIPKIVGVEKQSKELFLGESLS